MQTLSSTKFRNLARLILPVTLLLTVTLTACGYRGPLYLPDENPAGEPAQNSAPENAGDESAEESDDEEDGKSSG